MWEDVWLLEEHGSRTRNFSFFLRRSARTFLILPLLLQRSLWWEASPKAACLTPVSHVHLPPGQFYSDSQQHHKLRGPQTVIIHPTPVSLLGSLLQQKISSALNLMVILSCCCLQRPYIQLRQYSSCFCCLNSSTY